MNYKQSLGRSVNRLIKNSAPLGLVLALASAFVAKMSVDWMGPELSTISAIVCYIVVGTMISVALFIVLASILALFAASTESTTGAQDTDRGE